MNRAFSSSILIALSLSTAALASAEPVDPTAPVTIPAPEVAPIPAVEFPVAGVPADQIKLFNDEDIHRHASDVNYLDGLGVAEVKFAENGFNWQLIRFTNLAKPDGPLWMVPHDDENAAFEAMIDAVRQYGGVGITVNTTGWGRTQPGNGTCGTRSRIVSSCDPNRNFDKRSPIYTAAFLDARPAGQPIIALHTNKPGYGDGAGHISMYASAKPDTFFGNGSVEALNNPDTFGLMSYRAGAPTPKPVTDCRVALNAGGINFWHEKVGASDGSMSNYLILNRPEITYFNAESRQEADLAVSAARHGMMASAFLKDCQKPVEPAPDAPPPVVPTLP